MPLTPVARERLSAVWHAVLVGIVATVGALIAPHGARDLDLLGYGLIVGSALSLIALSWSTWVVLCATTAAFVAYAILGYPGLAAIIPVIVALYKCVRAGHRSSIALPLVAVSCATAEALISGDDVREVLQQTFLVLGWLVAAVALAEAAREWRQNLERAEERISEAERTRDEVARRRVAEERVRIARELHDSLTHAISVIRVQSGVAVHLARKRGEAVPEALEAIQEASSDAVRELRSTLDVLRDDDRLGLDRLEELVTRMRRAGITVASTVDGEARTVPEDVDLAAYRIVQEALTNVARHAGAATTQVEVRYESDSLVVQVVDDGSADPAHPPEPGTGLIGMAERARALGGTVRAEPRAGGGFTVRAEFPLTSDDRPVEEVAR